MPIPIGKKCFGVFKVARSKINNNKGIIINSSKNLPDTL